MVSERIGRPVSAESNQVDGYQREIQDEKIKDKEEPKAAVPSGSQRSGEKIYECFNPRSKRPWQLLSRTLTHRTMIPLPHTAKRRCDIQKTLFFSRELTIMPVKSTVNDLLETLLSSPAEHFLGECRIGIYGRRVS